MSANRRIQRSVRVAVALVILALAAAVVIGALVARGALWLGIAAVVAWAAGAAATRILHNELRQSRRQHAHDRAEQAKAYATLASRRATENATFASAMRQKVADHAANLERLKAALRLAEKRAALAEQTAGRNKVGLAKAQREVADLKSRIAELDAQVGEQTARIAGQTARIAELESIAADDDMPAVVELMAWEQRAEVEQDQRRRA